ncbi:MULTISPECIES: hypothetical protein [Haloferax]|uniref:Integrase n=2 Tax=Haloferax TaxID=2251 RepID=A0A6G1YZ69_9EURY|nr:MULTISPECIES: hypothetical protein [Haloferax]KAB1186937.1 hypothetical protein Hfx1149_02390 [Haloferax sp. CBA1149]MRW79566.1 hypothetical protein [Haloferax marinisediminis]
MGIYKHIEDVPPRSRLERFDSRYKQTDVWVAFASTRNSEFDSAHYAATIRKAGSSFKLHMRDRGRHHALAHPADIESWLVELAETRTLNTVYSEYWVRIEEFYRWLQRHSAHPHVYNPAWMAAASYPTADAMWKRKMRHQTAGEE